MAPHLQFNVGELMVLRSSVQVSIHKFQDIIGKFAKDTLTHKDIAERLEILKEVDRKLREAM